MNSAKNNNTAGDEKALDGKVRQMKEDYETEWWRAREGDEFNLKQKLLRVGCRPLKRKHLACQKSADMDSETYHRCKVIL